MKYSETNRYLYAFWAVAAGLLTGQAIGTLHVYLSNSRLYQDLQLVRSTGYLPVPNEHVWDSFQSFGTAFRAGIFFTLSIGAGLTLTALLGAWSWDRVFKRSRKALAVYLILWFSGVAAVNLNGFSPMAAAYVLLVPLPVFLVALLLMPSKEVQGRRVSRIVFLVLPFCLLLVFLPLARQAIFLDIRDAVLLGNPAGRQINRFYYDYTLYAAEALKSLEQKTIRTCSLSLAKNASHREVIINIFLARDYLVTDGEGPVDLDVVEQDNRLLFKDSGRIVLTTTLREFAANPASIFQQFSMATDRNGPLRLVAFAGMLAGAPWCLYIMVQGLLSLILALVIRPGKAALSGAIVCLLAGIALAVPLYAIRGEAVDMKNYTAALDSGHLRERLAALRYIAENNLVDERIVARAQTELKNSSIAERYWFVRAVGSSRSAGAYSVLLAALQDPDTNVVCMAFYGLGRQKNTSGIGVILQRMAASDSWYEQWYGYRALKALGWRQGGS